MIGGENPNPMSFPCRIPQLTTAIDLVGEISRQLSERKSAAVNEICTTFEELERALQQRKNSLLQDLDTISVGKQKVGVRRPGETLRRHSSS